MTSADSDIPVLAGIRRELVDGIARAARPRQPRWRPLAGRGLPRWALATLGLALVALAVSVGLNLRAPRGAHAAGLCDVGAAQRTHPRQGGARLRSGHALAASAP
jgi:hypothetical protein